MYCKITIILLCTALQFTSGCQSSKSSPEEGNIDGKPTEKNSQKTANIPMISEWLSSRKVKLNGFGSDEITKIENVKYEGLQNLTRVNLNNDKSKYYFFDELENCLMLYINNEDDLGKLSTQEIISEYGEPETILRSRVGKTANHYVYSQRGFAFSEVGDKVVLF